jgi:hypothetical protein
MDLHLFEVHRHCYSDVRSPTVSTFASSHPTSPTSATCVLIAGPLAPVDIPRSVCRRWFAVLIAVTLSLYMALEVTLALRGMLQTNLLKTRRLIFCLPSVYVLYKRERIIVIFMATLLLAGAGVNINCAVKLFQQLEFDSQCVGYGMSKEIVLLRCVSLKYRDYLIT